MRRKNYIVKECHFEGFMHLNTHMMAFIDMFDPFDLYAYRKIL